MSLADDKAMLARLKSEHIELTSKVHKWMSHFYNKNIFRRQGLSEKIARGREKLRELEEVIAKLEREIRAEDGTQKAVSEL